MEPTRIDHDPGTNAVGHSYPVQPTPQLTTILHDLEKSDLDARRIAGALSDAQANWRPDETAWSIAQCLDHLGRANTVYAAALDAAVKDAQKEEGPGTELIQPGWFSRFFLRNLEPPPKIRIRAPKKIVPGSQIAIGQALEAFLRSHEDVRAVIRDSAGLNLNRIRFHNPFIGLLRFTVGTGLLIVAAHDRRHLWQARNLRECSEFPKS